MWFQNLPPYLRSHPGTDDWLNGPGYTWLAGRVPELQNFQQQQATSTTPSTPVQLPFSQTLMPSAPAGMTARVASYSGLHSSTAQNGNVPRSAPFPGIAALATTIQQEHGSTSLRAPRNAFPQQLQAQLAVAVFVWPFTVCSSFIFSVIHVLNYSFD